MPDSVDIGGSSGNTWAVIRAPMVFGTGYRDTYPANENWSRKYLGTGYANNAGYKYPKSDLCKARFLINESADPGAAPIVTGSLLGCSQKVISQEQDGFLVYLFLGCGDGRYVSSTWPFGSEAKPYEVVGSMSGLIDMDTTTMRQKFVGGFVNLTVNLYAGAPVTTYNFEITDALFPDDPGNASAPLYQDRGQKFAEVIVPYNTTPYPGPLWWTINSLTLP